VGLLNPNGDEVVPTCVLEMTQAEQSFSFDGFASKPVPSILRGFSAPIVLDREVSREERAFLLAHDTDAFNRWEANRNLARDCLVAMIRDGAGPDTAWLDGLKRVVRDDALDPAFRALMLSLPAQSEMAQVLFEMGTVPDPDAIWQAADDLRDHMAEAWKDFLPDLRASVAVDAPYKPDAEQTGKRSLGSALLALQTRLDGGAEAQSQYDTADNMTLQLSALSQLISAGQGDAAVKAFEQQWKQDRLVMDKWFGLQVGMAKPDVAVDVAEGLVEHPAFDMGNPNRFRAVMGGFAMNHAGFHRKDGAGYAFLADWLIKLDDKNPQTTARMCSVFQTWKRYDADRQALIRAQLQRIKDKPKLSRDTDEMVSRILG
jgi:aminopeptidase N